MGPGVSINASMSDELTDFPRRLAVVGWVVCAHADSMATMNKSRAGRNMMDFHQSSEAAENDRGRSRDARNPRVVAPCDLPHGEIMSSRIAGAQSKRNIAPF